jgi:hypothetical protein
MNLALAYTRTMDEFDISQARSHVKVSFATLIRCMLPASFAAYCEGLRTNVTAKDQIDRRWRY